MEQLEAMGQQTPPYYLIYWGEHVFPATRLRLADVVKFQQEFIDKFKMTRERLFMMMPPILSIVHLEFKCSLLPLYV